MYLFKYVVVIDFDEVIVPTHHYNLTSLIHHLELNAFNSSLSTEQFQNVSTFAMRTISLKRIAMIMNP